jgi:hypothetical protein
VQRSRVLCTKGADQYRRQGQRGVPPRTKVGRSRRRRSRRAGDDQPFGGLDQGEAVGAGEVGQHLGGFGRGDSVPFEEPSAMAIVLLWWSRSIGRTLPLGEGGSGSAEPRLRALKPSGLRRR